MNFGESEVENHRNRILFAIDDVGLQGGVDVGRRHRHRLGPESRERPHMDAVLHGAQAQPGQIGRLAHRPGGGGDVTEAVFAPGQRDQAVLGKFGENILADRAVEHATGVGVIPEQEGDVGDQGCRHKAADRPGGGDHQIDGAELGADHHLPFAAENAVGEDLDPQAAGRALGHLLGHHRGGDAVMGGFAKDDAQGEGR